MKNYGYDPCEQLAAALGRVTANTRTEKVAAMAYLQASLAQAAVQALIDLLRQQNVISQERIQEALNDAYDTRFKQLSGSNGAVVLPHPTARPL
jgi:hypothetical protein